MNTLALITAHAGCDGTPMDSVASLQLAARLGADAAEMDVNCDESGSLVLFHDKPPPGQRCGSFAGALETAAQTSLMINCDMKESALVLRVLEEAERQGLAPRRLVLTGSVAPTLLLREPSIPRRARVWLNIEQLLLWYAEEDAAEGWPFSRKEHPFETCLRMAPSLPALAARVAEDCHRLGVEGLNLPYLRRDGAREALAALAATGLPLSVWTVDDEADMEMLFELGVMNLTTRRVELALRTRAAWRRQKGSGQKGNEQGREEQEL